MSVTIKDIAKIANVSHTTVSRALNDSPRISGETKTQILGIARQLGYVPNLNAKSLVLAKSHIIGVFFSTLGEGTSPCFFQDTVRGVNSAIPPTYHVVVKGIDSYETFQAVNRQTFDGIIVMSQGSSDNAFIYHADAAGIPVVVLNRDIGDKRIANIISSDREGAAEAINHLVRLGHRRIAHIAGRMEYPSTQERLQGFLDVLLQRGIPPRKEYIVHGNYGIQSGYDAMAALLKLPEPPTAVFCANDEMSFGAMKAAGDAGVAIPGMLSVVGFDDTVFAQYSFPALTTVRRDMAVMAAWGTKLLLGRMEGVDQEEHLPVPVRLIVRKSTAFCSI